MKHGDWNVIPEIEISGITRLSDMDVIILFESELGYHAEYNWYEVGTSDEKIEKDVLNWLKLRIRAGDEFEWHPKKHIALGIVMNQVFNYF